MGYLEYAGAGLTGRWEECKGGDWDVREIGGECWRRGFEYL